MSQTFLEKLSEWVVGGYAAGAVAAGVMGFIAAWVLLPDGHALVSEAAAAWVQAIGAILAIVAAFATYALQERARAKAERSRREEEQSRANALGMAVAFRLNPYLALLKARFMELDITFRRDPAWASKPGARVGQPELAAVTVQMPQELMKLADRMNEMSGSAAITTLGAIGVVEVYINRIEHFRHVAGGVSPDAVKAFALQATTAVFLAFDAVRDYRRRLLQEAGIFDLDEEIVEQKTTTPSASTIGTAP